MAYFIVKTTKHPIGRGSLAYGVGFKSKKEAQEVIDRWNKKPQFRYLRLRAKKSR